MNKLWTIIKREYLTRVKSKGFVIGTILGPLIMSSFVLIPVLIARYSGPDKYNIVVLDQTGDAALFQRLNDLLALKRSGQTRYDLTREEVSPGEEMETRRQAFAERLTRKEIDGVFILPADALNQKELLFYSKNSATAIGRTRFGDAVNKAISERRIALAGLDAEKVRELTKDVELKTLNERGESGRGKIVLAFAMLMVLYLTILVYGVTVMRGVTEEKQNRIIEVLLSSVSPFYLMLGKVIGIGLVGLTQYLTWSLFGITLSALSAAPAFMMYADQIPKISPWLFVFFVVYYVLGYFLYATLYGMVGAIVSNEDDGQQAQMPITMTFMIPMILSSLVMGNPTGTTATILSLIPFFSPSLMFLRITFDAAPGWQIALSIALMVATILGVVWLAAKIYRVGVLMYGKRPTIPELVRWLRYS
ncbi:MAG: ABC transporter permease [Acidobacteria bacterium]|nr:ABC transporter permease [Acidobacteriota bacterium]